MELKTGQSYRLVPLEDDPPPRGAGEVKPPASSPPSVLSKQWKGRDTLTVPEVAKILGLSKPAAYAAANDGTLPAIRIGKRLIVPRVALERLLASAGAAR
jgi:excisionase family DNA binding protein